MNCLGCLKPVGATELLACVHCKGIYHHNCVNMTSPYYMANLNELNRSWQCPSCNNVTSRRRGAENTPVRAIHQRRTNERRTDGPAINLNIASVSGLDQTATSQANDMSCDESLLDMSNDFEGSNTTHTEYSKILNAPRSAGHDSIAYKDFAALLDIKLSEMREAIIGNTRAEIEALKSEFCKTTELLTARLSALESDISAVREKVDTLEAENSSLKAELAQMRDAGGETGDTRAMSDTIAALKCELNERDQQALLNDVEISGVPETKGESIVHIVISIGAKLGVAIEDRDIVFASRVGPLRAQDESFGGSRASRPRPIVVRLVRRALRDQFIKGSRVRRGTTTDGLGLPPHEARKLYINERLTRTNRIIFGRARDLGGKRNWTYVWTKEGRILARKTDKSKVYYIRSENDLTRVFETVLPTENNV